MGIFGRVGTRILAGWENTTGHVLGVVNPVQLLHLGLVREQGASGASQSNGQVVGNVVVHCSQRHGGEGREEF